MDVKSAFLHGDLKEDIYMKQHEGFIEDPSLVFILRNHCNDSNKPRRNGIPKWMPSSCHKNLKYANQIAMYT